MCLKKSINLPKGASHKLVPKFMGPYRGSEDFGNNSYRIELPDALKQRGITVCSTHTSSGFTSQMTTLFPGRSEERVPDFGDTGKE